jgi:hypothetical protein
VSFRPILAIWIRTRPPEKTLFPTVSPLVVAAGAVLAALIAGFFSYVNLVSAKESKVSEFRLKWIDGLREEISRFAAAVHELVRLSAIKQNLELKDYVQATSEPFRLARESITAIQLRLNPKCVTEDPDSPEAKLMNEINRMREAFLSSKYSLVVEGIDQVRILAAPLLKREWERVKTGESGYRRARTAAVVLLIAGILFIAFATYRVSRSEGPEQVPPSTGNQPVPKAEDRRPAGDT